MSEEKESDNHIQLGTSPPDQKLLKGKDNVLFYLRAHIAIFNKYLLSWIYSSPWTGQFLVEERTGQFSSTKRSPLCLCISSILDLHCDF